MIEHAEQKHDFPGGSCGWQSVKALALKSDRAFPVILQPQCADGLVSINPSNDCALLLRSEGKLAVARADVQHAPSFQIHLCHALLNQFPGFGKTLLDRKSTRLNSSHGSISYAVFCLKKKRTTH